MARTCQISEIKRKPTTRVYCVCRARRKCKCSNNSDFVLHDNIALHVLQKITY